MLGDRYFGPGDELSNITQWFDNGGSLRLKDGGTTEDALADFRKVPELLERTSMLGFAKSAEKGLLVSGCEFILEGLCAQKKISRSEEKGIYTAAKKSQSQDPIFQNYERYKKHYN